MPAYYLEALIVALGIALLMAEAFVPTPKKAWLGFAAAAGLAVVFCLNLIAISPADRPEAAWTDWPLWNFYLYDPLARFYKGFALLCTALVVLMAVDYRALLAKFTENSSRETGTGEFYVLPVFTCAGMMWMASARDLAGAFVALELVTLTFYILVAFMRRNVGSLEAGVKYLILGALSTGFLVYGIAWIYGATGTLRFDEIAAASGTLASTKPLLFGIAFVIAGLGFKIGAVPMQVWIPDVYQGAPTPTTAFLSVGSKAAGFILTLRFLEPLLAQETLRGPILILLGVLAAATLLFGNFAAIAQANFKRLLAYSSIAHAGFLLLALAAWKGGTPTSPGSAAIVSFYLATYLLMTLGVFFILAQIRISRGGEAVADFNGLGKTQPGLALAVTLFLAALAGIPLTAGFWGKFFVFSLAIEARLAWAVVIAILSASAGFYYYFKVIRAMWWETETGPSVAVPLVTRVCLVVLAGTVLLTGFWPQVILDWIGR